MENHKITEHGRQIQKLPCHPRIAHMLLATDLVAILEEGDPLPRETGIDINLRIEALRRHRKGGLIANKELRIGRIVLQLKQLANPNEDKVVAIVSKAIEKEGASLLNFSPQFTQWQNRVMGLKKWQADVDWPDVSTAELLKNNKG